MKIRKTSLIKSASIFSSMTFLSRILGFLRDVIVASVFGASPMVDAFLVAFRIPNFFRRLFAEGAFTQAFVPILSEHEGSLSDSETKQFIGRVGGTLASATLLVTVVGVILAPAIVTIFAPGFSQDEDPTRLVYATEFLRITFPYLFFISMTAFFAAILNYFGYYGVPAFTPVWLNLSMIVGALYFSGFFDVSISGLVWGVFLAGVIQFLFLLPFLYRKKLLPRLEVAWHDPGVRQVVKAMIPALFGVSIAQINLLLDTAFASFLVNGSITWLYLSDRLMNFPLGVIGIALSTVMLPRMSRSFMDSDKDSFSKIFNWSSKLSLFFSVPATVGLISLALPLVITLLYRNNFTYQDAVMTSKSLIGFSFGLPAFMLVKVLVSAFYSQKDFKRPVRVGGIAMVVNVIFNILFIKQFAHAGLAFATSIAAFVNCGLLWFYLRKSPTYIISSNWKSSMLQIIVASSIMLGWILFWSPNIVVWMQVTGSMRVLYLFGLIITAIVVYLIGLFAMGVRIQDIHCPVEK